MSKGKQLLKIIGGIVSILGGFISISLTVNLGVSIFSPMGNYWRAIGFIVGIIFNIGEIGFFIDYVIHSRVKSLFFGIIFAAISVSATVGAMQVALMRGSLESAEFKQKVKEIDLIDKQIALLNETAQKQQRINHITKSVKTLDEANILLERRNKSQAELNVIKNRGAGLNAELYRSYASILGIDSVMTFAFLLNSVFAILLEFLFVNYTVESFQPERRSESVKDQSGENSEPKILKLFKGTGTENKKKIGFEITSKAPTVKGEKDDKNLERSSKKYEPSSNSHFEPSASTEFEPGLNQKFEPGEKNNCEPSESDIPKHILTRLKREYKKTGKSDATILWLYDFGFSNLSEIGRIAGKNLKGNRKKISPSYVSRVVKRERRAR